MHSFYKKYITVPELHTRVSPFSPAPTLSKTDSTLWYFLGGWLLLNLFSAAFTGLSYDEAYYWMYSKFPDWGYFDHPPMIALLDRLGYFFLNGEIGVRLFTVLCSCLTLWLLYKLCGVQQVFIFALLVVSIFPLHMFGFISVPDVPLLLFSVLFFYTYRIFLEENTLPSAITVAMTMAGLMYSKYHGIILIAAVMASNPRLLLNKKFWLAGIFALALYLPHLLWQYTHDFISLRYHLVDRSARVYQVKYTIEYVFAQIFFYGPLAGLLLFYYTLRSSSENTFERGLKYTFVAFMAFFLFSSFKGHVEANWTIPALVPMFYFSMRYISRHTGAFRVLKIIAAISFPVFIGARLILAFAQEAYVPRMGEMVGWEKYTKQLLTEAGDLPIIANSYQEASMLSFYSGRIIPSLNIRGRSNQFDLWGFSYAYEGQKVVLLNSFMSEGKKLLDPKKKWQTLTFIDKLPVYQGLQLETTKQYRGRAGEIISIPLQLHTLSGKIPRHYFPATVIRYAFYPLDFSFCEKESWSCIYTPAFQHSTWATVRVELPLKKGVYKVKFSFEAMAGAWETQRSTEIEVF